jgi:hypothetical protein
MGHLAVKFQCNVVIRPRYGSYVYQTDGVTLDYFLESQRGRPMHNYIILLYFYIMQY